LSIIFLGLTNNNDQVPSPVLPVWEINDLKYVNQKIICIIYQEEKNINYINK